MNKLRKVIAVLLAVLLCISLGGCVTTKSWAVKIGDENISAAMYVYQLRQQMSAYLSQNSMSENEETWNAEYSDELTVGEYIQTTTVQSLAATVTWRAQFDKLGLSFTDEEQANIQKSIDTMIEGAGGKQVVVDGLKQNGLNYDEYINSVYYDTQKILKVVNYYFGKNGLEPVSEQEILTYFKENYARAKHILISTVNEQGNTLTGQDMKKAKNTAQEVFEKAKNVDEAAFDKLMEQYNSDEGAAAYPDGYVFTTGEMVDEFEKASFDMKVGETRLVQTDYGFHIIRKLSLEDEKVFTEEIRQKMLMNLKDKEISELFSQWQKDFDCKVNTGVLKKYTCNSIKSGEDQSISDEERLQALAGQLGLEEVEK